VEVVNGAVYPTTTPRQWPLHTVHVGNALATREPHLPLSHGGTADAAFADGPTDDVDMAGSGESAPIDKAGPTLVEWVTSFSANRGGMAGEDAVTARLHFHTEASLRRIMHSADAATANTERASALHAGLLALADRVTRIAESKGETNDWVTFLSSQVDGEQCHPPPAGTSHAEVMAFAGEVMADKLARVLLAGGTVTQAAKALEGAIEGQLNSYRGVQVPVSNHREYHSKHAMYGGRE
jgi:hypothetical protein